MKPFPAAVLAAALHLSVLAAPVLANPVIKLTGAERARLNRLVNAHSQGYNAYVGEEAIDPANARLFLALAEESHNLPTRCSAIGACMTIYSANPKAPASFNGKPYQRLALTDEFRRVTRNLLQDPDARVREYAARMGGACIWGDHPDETIFPLLKAAYEAAPDANSQRNILGCFFDCHAGHPAVAEMILIGLRAQHPKLIEMALAGIARRYRKHTDYGAAFRTQVTPLIKAQLTAPEADLRYRAAEALLEMTPGQARRAVMEPIFAQLLKDSNGGTVASTLELVASCHAVGVIGQVAGLIGDTRSGQLEFESLADDRNSSRSGDTSPVQHHALKCLHVLSQDLVGPRGFRYAFRDRTGGVTSRQLAGEVARARQWLHSHSDLVRPHGS